MKFQRKCSSRNRASKGPTVSICIPVYLRNELDKGFLNELLLSIESQNLMDHEVVISEDAKSPIRLNKKVLDDSFTGLRTVRIVSNPNSGISSNTNFSIMAAGGEIIKLMFQDDLFSHERALGDIVSSLRNSNKKWLLSASDHVNQQTKKTGPVFHPKLKKGLFVGVNSVSSPSVTAFRAGHFIEFSNTLELMMDCEWYIRMVHNFGQPVILNRTAIINRLHPNQAQHSLKSSLNGEIEKIKLMHNRSRLRKLNCKCRI